MERSGHLTKDGVRSYERTSSAQLKTLCRTLAASVPSTENTATFNCKGRKLIFNPFTDNCAILRRTNSPTKPQTEGKKPPEAVNDVMKQLNFQGMTDCTFNISLNYSKST